MVSQRQKNIPLSCYMNTTLQQMVHMICTLLYINTMIGYFTGICIIYTFLLLFSVWGILWWNFLIKMNLTLAWFCWTREKVINPFVTRNPLREATKHIKFSSCKHGECKLHLFTPKVFSWLSGCDKLSW